MLDIRFKAHIKCPRHPRYKPEMGVLPECEYCDAIYAIALYVHIAEKRVQWLTENAPGASHGQQADGK